MAIPCRVADSTSILSYPTARVPTTLRLLADLKSSSSNRQSDSIIIPSNSLLFSSNTSLGGDADPSQISTSKCSRSFSIAATAALFVAYTFLFIHSSNIEIQ